MRVWSVQCALGSAHVAHFAGGAPFSNCPERGPDVKPECTVHRALTEHDNPAGGGTRNIKITMFPSLTV